MSENNKSTSVQLWPWQKRALENGRTEIFAATLMDLTNVAPPNQRWWAESEMRRLIQLRHSGESWAAITAQFPGRTLQGVKQTYRKRRFATELQMEKEALTESSSHASHIAATAQLAATGIFFVFPVPLPLPASQTPSYISLYLQPTNTWRLGNRKDCNMKPWDEKALNRGRISLPEGPGQRQWLPLQPSERLYRFGAPAKASESSNPSYGFWKESEVHRLIEMRSGGAKGSAIAQAFPNRTLEALKQAFHKRRHAVEQKVGEEKTNERSAEKDQIKSSA
ncbi:hypothetical protein FCOIX_3064 [Fusarium coicis]|nr:hypothetical protein FCOIX_3064 [Fusarium coicis]